MTSINQKSNLTRSSSWTFSLQERKYLLFNTHCLEDQAMSQTVSNHRPYVSSLISSLYLFPALLCSASMLSVLLAYYLASLQKAITPGMELLSTYLSSRIPHWVIPDLGWLHQPLCPIKHLGLTSIYLHAEPLVLFCCFFTNPIHLSDGLGLFHLSRPS